MSKEVAVVDLHGCLWQPDMTLEVLRRMQHHLEISNNFRINSEIDALRVIANPGVKGRNAQVIHDIGRGAANACLAGINETVLDDLQAATDNGLGLIAVSSSPDFAVRSALKKLKKETGLAFTDSIETVYEVNKHAYTGKFKPAKKEEMLKQKLHKLHARAAVAFIGNKETDAPWSHIAHHVVTNSAVHANPNDY
jgi:hypothetical protein